MSINLYSGSGRLTADPKFTPGKDGDENKNRAMFTLAIEDVYSKEERADFVPVVVWGKLANAVSKHCAKGKFVTVVGKIRTNRVDSTEPGGKPNYYWEVSASQVEFGADAKNQKGKEAPKTAETAPANPLNGMSPEQLLALAAALGLSTKTSPVNRTADPFIPTTAAQ